MPDLLPSPPASIEPRGSFERRHTPPERRDSGSSGDDGDQGDDGVQGDGVGQGDDVGQAGTLRGLLEELASWLSVELVLASVGFACLGYVKIQVSRGIYYLLKVGFLPGHFFGVWIAFQNCSCYKWT